MIAGGIAIAAPNYASIPHTIQSPATTVRSGSTILWEGRIQGDPTSIAAQNVLLDNGVLAQITANHDADRITVSGNNGEHLEFSISNLRSHLESRGRGISDRDVSDRQPADIALKAPSGCSVATGLAGVAHSALWGSALGGPAGMAAGAAVGLFWAGIGTQC